MEIKKVIVPVAGLGTRFLPLTKVLSKPILPLVDRPMVAYIVKEAKEAGAEKVIFVISENEKNILAYFKKNPKIEKILKKRNKKELLETLQKADGEFEGISFSKVIQKIPRGDGDAILKAQQSVGKNACGVLFGDDVIVNSSPALSQLNEVFKTCQKPVVCLKQVPEENISSYGVVKVEKIASRLYKIKDIVEKPKTEAEAPSNLAIVGRYIITPLVFDYLKKISSNEKGEIILADAFKRMLKDGKMIYGYEIEGDWLECGNKINWLKSNVKLSIQHPEFGSEIKKFIKDLK
jgi:UTP--glucose-1-phosphate uridylyltransferase